MFKWHFKVMTKIREYFGFESFEGDKPNRIINTVLIFVMNKRISGYLDGFWRAMLIVTYAGHIESTLPGLAELCWLWSCWCAPSSLRPFTPPSATTWHWKALDGSVNYTIFKCFFGFVSFCFQREGWLLYSPVPWRKENNKSDGSWKMPPLFNVK